MTAQLPEGWTVEDDTEDTKLQSTLPPGWTVEEGMETAKERDEEKLKKAAGPFAVPEKTPEELKKMTVEEKRDYAEELNRQREYLQSSQFTKGLLSGLTFGATENLEALKPIELEEFSPFSLFGAGGEITGSFVPLSGLMKVFAGPAIKIASKSPVLQRQLSSLATMFGVGASDIGLRKLAHGEVPSSEDLLEHGLGWAALDALLQGAGTVGRFAKALLNRAKATGNNRLEMLKKVNRELGESGVDMSDPEAVSALALDILERPITPEETAGRELRAAEIGKTSEAAENLERITPKDLKTRKISEAPVNRLTNNVRELSEPAQPKAIDFTKEAEALEKDAIQNQIDTVGMRAATEEELGVGIREDIESQLEARKEEYRPLYKRAEEAAREMFHIPQNTAREAGEKLQRISRLATKPAGYSSVITTLENVLGDAGFVIQRNPKGEIENIISGKDVPVENTIELARRLNEIIDYEAVEPTVKDALRSVARAAKRDIREGLAGNPEGLAAFELAEEAHAATAQKFSTDAIRNIRKQQAGEKVSKMAEAPTTLGQLKAVLSPQQFLQLEREMLEKLNAQNYDRAKKMLKQSERHLSEENRRLARDIVESKNPHNPEVKQKLARDAILTDMSNAFTTGARPEKALQMWKSPKGQKLVKETFHNSPNWPSIKEYLEKQSFNDMASSVLKDGKLDLKKFKAFMRDPAVVNNIRAQGGEEAVTFFRNLDTQVNQLERNMKLLDRLPSKEQIMRGKQLSDTERFRGSKILKRMAQKDFPVQAKISKWRDWIKDQLGLNTQAAMNVFGVAKLGGIATGAYTLGIPTTVVSLIGLKMLNKMLTSPKIRKAFLEATKYQTNTLKFILSLEHLGNVMDEEGI